MNQQALLRKVKQMQNEMLETQKEIEETEFVGESNGVKVIMKGTKEIVRVEVDSSFELNDEDDRDMLGDLIVAASAICYKEITKVTEEKMSKYQAMLGGFGGFGF